MKTKYIIIALIVIYIIGVISAFIKINKRKKADTAAGITETLPSPFMSWFCKIPQ